MMMIMIMIVMICSNNDTVVYRIPIILILTQLVIPIRLRLVAPPGRLHGHRHEGGPAAGCKAFVLRL